MFLVILKEEKTCVATWDTVAMTVPSASTIPIAQFSKSPLEQNYNLHVICDTYLWQDFIDK